jgi:flavin-dependent dehydrogenase
VSEFTETIIVGGGQAGLAISYYLKQEGREHLVLERAPAIANAWRNQRWDSFTLVTPNFQVRMPGAEYDGNDPYGFMSLRKVVKYFDDYVQRYRLPIRCGVEVQGVEKRESVFQVRTTGVTERVLRSSPATLPAHDYFGQILDSDGTVLVCVHEWGAHEHPSLMSPDHGTHGKASCCSSVSMIST